MEAASHRSQPVHQRIRFLAEEAADAEAGGRARTAPVQPDPSLVMTTCANCGAQMIERKCKLICTCGYFLSCSDYY